MDERPSESAQERTLTVRAVARMAAQCELPDLVPECPFYETDASGAPACAEQCLDFIARFPEEQAAQESFVVGGGLVARRQQPRRRAPAPDAQPFDAGQMFLEDCDKPIDQWRFVSLVVALGRVTFATNQALGGLQGVTGPEVLAELVRRGIDLGTLAPMLVQMRALAVGTGLFFHFAMDAVAVGKDFIRDPHGWIEALDPDFKVEHFAANRGRYVAAIIAVLANAGPEACVTDHVPTRAEVFAASENPPAQSPLEEGMWFMERFGQTYLAEWSGPSRSLEWDYIRGRRVGCAPAGHMRARVVDPNDLAPIIADDHCDDAEAEAGSARPEQFASLAMEKIRRAEFEQAVSLCRAAQELWPERRTDLPNNLGFCLIPVNPREAVEVLERAIDETATPLLTRANLSVALHFAGESDRAASVIADALRDGAEPSKGATVWLPGAGTWSFRPQDDLVEYGHDLAVHYAGCAGGCDTFAGIVAPD